MKLYGVPASRVIRHFDVNGKYCPGVYGWNSASGSESAWNDFKKKIGSGAVATPATPAQPTTAKKYYRVRKTWADAQARKVLLPAWQMPKRVLIRTAVIK